MSVIRHRNDTWNDYWGIIKSIVWDDPVEIDSHLFLGNYTHSFGYSRLRNQIEVLVNATNYPYQIKNEFCLNIPIYDLNYADIGPYLEQSYHFIDNHITNDRNVLVYCIFGRSRSVAICVYYLMKKYQISFEQAYQRIENKKMFININESFKHQIISSLK